MLTAAMSNASQPKPGFPVLVHLTPSAPLSLAFQLRIRYNVARKQASLMLGTAASAYLQGARDEHTFVAQYDADNLDSHTPNSTQVQLQVPPARLEELKRDAGTPLVVPLTLHLKRPCPLWCPRLDALVPVAESAAAKASFNELVQLSKATTVHITLNRKWLTDEHVRLLDMIKSRSETLSGYPVARYYSTLFNQADWTVFRPESPSKRPRDGKSPHTHSTSSSNAHTGAVSAAPSSPPLYKRTDAHKSPSSTPILSPTEVASSPSYSHISRRLLGLQPQGNEDEHDFQAQAITRVVERHLPGLLQQLLPDIVKQNVPDLFILPATFPSYTSDLSTSSPPNLNTMPYPRDLTPLGAALLPSIIDHLQPQVQNMISSSLNRGVESRRKLAVDEIGDAADEKLAEMYLERARGMDVVEKERVAIMDDLRHEREEGVKVLQQQRDDGLDNVEAERDRGMRDLRQETTEAVEALRQEKEEAVDDLHRHAEQVLDELRGDAADVGASALQDVDARITDRADEIVAAARQQLDMIRDTAMRQNKGERTLWRGRPQGRRAGKGGYRGLGHR